jgi:hypothetical protein
MLERMKIAQILARAGLHLGVATVGRMLKEEPQPMPEGLGTEIAVVVKAGLILSENEGILGLPRSAVFSRGGGGDPHRMGGLPCSQKSALFLDSEKRANLLRQPRRVSSLAKPLPSRTIAFVEGGEVTANRRLAAAG